MAISVVQVSNGAESNASAFATDFNSATTANNLIVAGLCHTAAANRQYTFTDDAPNGSYTKLTRHYHNGWFVQISYFENAAAITSDVTSTVDASSSQNRLIQAYEIDGVDTSGTFDVEGEFIRASNDSTHYSGETTEIDTVANVFVLACGVHNSTAGTLTEDANFTMGYTTSRGLIQYRVSAGALTNERGSWTSSTSRNCFGGIASFVGSAGGGGPTFIPKTIMF